MKTKKALKLIKEILVLANELQQKQNVSKIPECKIYSLVDVVKYENRIFVEGEEHVLQSAERNPVTGIEKWNLTKVSPNLDKVILANKGVDTNGIYAQWSKAVKEALAKKLLSETPFDDLYNKSKEEENKDFTYIRDIFSVYPRNEIINSEKLTKEAIFALEKALADLK